MKILGNIKNGTNGVNEKINAKLIIVLIIALLIFVALFFGLKSKKNILDKGKEIAVVNGVKIYEVDIQNRLNSISLNTKIDIESLPQDVLKAMILEVSVNNQIYKEAKKLGYYKDEKIKNLVQEYKKELVREKFLNEQIYSKITEKEALAEYEKIAKHLEGKEKRKIKHILVENEDEIERVRRSVMRSGNFEKIAKSKSIDKASAENGGDIGYVLKEELAPEFGDVAFILKVGEISKPVKTQYGWHIIKVEDVRPATFLSFDEAKDGIIQSLQQQAIQEYLMSLTKDLKIEMKIEQNLDAPSVLYNTNTTENKDNIETNVNLNNTAEENK